jgi:hypothetical protein
MPTFIRTTSTFLAGLAATTVLAACASTDTTPESTPETSSATPAEEAPTSAGPSLNITIGGEEIEPNAQEIDLAAGEKLTIEVQSDRAGELHVHSTPEQLVEFDAGTTSTQLAVETPGTVEVEEHDTGAVVALIEVR